MDEYPCVHIHAIPYITFNMTVNTSFGIRFIKETESSLQPQYAEECYESPLPPGAAYFEEDDECAPQRSSFIWPPPRDESHDTPTAAPLYIPPPETQHVVAKHIDFTPPAPSGQLLNDYDQQQQQPRRVNQPDEEVFTSSEQPPHWQSRSAPQLTSGMQVATEIESSSDSYTSTSTTTTTTSEEYQRMYAAQVQAYQMQQAYEQTDSEYDYNMDMELASMQQNQPYLNSNDFLSGRRSTQECADSLADPLSTYKLVAMVREVTPSPAPPLQSSQGSRHVAFMDEPEVKEIEANKVKISRDGENRIEMTQTVETRYTPTCDVHADISIEEEDRLIIEDRSNILESQRIFQPTPEIKIEIAPVRQIPPTKIPNPVPKEWINPMVRALTTAPDVPFHMVECPCPKPSECVTEIQRGAEKRIEAPIQLSTETDSPRLTLEEREVVTKTPSESATADILCESPARGSLLSKAMATAPEFTVCFVPPASDEIPLPEETKPYMPPPIDMKPYMQEDYRPKSPFLSALTTAPDKPFESQFERDVPIHILDLPTPKEHLSMSDALCTASGRAYTPLNPENATHMFEEIEKSKERKRQEFQVLDNEAELGIALSAEPPETVQYYTTEKCDSSQRKTSTFAAMQAFQSTNESSSPRTPRNSVIPLGTEEPDVDYMKYCKAKERNQKRLDYFHKKEEEMQQQSIQTEKQNLQLQSQEQIDTKANTCKESPLCSYTKECTAFNSSSAVQQMSTSTAFATAIINNTINGSLPRVAQPSLKIETRNVIDETCEELEHSDVSFPPPSPLSHLKEKAVKTGLHKADSIPKYQRNWTVLPTQSPVRTPEPQELRENVPLAFVDAPKPPSNTSITDSNTVHRPVPQLSTQVCTLTNQQHTLAAARSSVTSTKPAIGAAQRKQPELKLTKLTVPIIVEDRSGPVSMAFQPLDEHLQPENEMHTPNRPCTPSLLNKPAPIIPFYQTPEKLCFDECPATHARAYDQRSASPFPDRARSPAPGPPPNPLAAIRAPRLKDTELSPTGPRMLQTGSITTGQSYLGAQHAQQQGQVLSHFESSSQEGMQSFSQKPETFEERKIGDLTIQKRENASRMEEQKKTQLQSQTTTQVGNTQIERHRKVTEEFEHMQSAKSIEIRTGTQLSSNSAATSTERRQSYGKTGFVANQARRLSGLEQEITNLTSQSQAISARAATMTDAFPQFSAAAPKAKFPLKPVLPPHDEPTRPSYIFSADSSNKIVGPPPGFQGQQEGQLKQHDQQQFHYSNATTASSSFSSSIRANSAVDCSITNASATNNFANSAAANMSSTVTSTMVGGVCPVTGTFCRPGHTCCKQQLFMQPTAPTALTSTNANNVNNGNNRNNFNANRLNASTGSSIASKSAQAQSQTPAAAQPTSVPAPTPAQAPASAPASAIAPSAPQGNVSDNSNNDGSAGTGGKGGAYGATSIPKRGRGIYNRAVAPGARVPLCNSCNIAIRGPFITALGRIWCPEHFICVNGNCRRPLQDIGFVEEKGDLYCEYCFEKYLAPTCSKCGSKIKGDCLNAIGRQFHPECFSCGHCGKIFGNTPFFLEDGNAYCEADWNELFTTKCFACGFPVEAGDRWVEALNHNYHSQCFNCTYCKQNLEGKSFYNKGGRPFCKNHAR